MDIANRFVLSKKDSFIPDGYIGMYSIFRNPSNKAVYITESRCQSMRQRTFDAVLELCKRYNTSSFAKLFNYNAQVIGEAGLNFFGEHKKIKPIANIIECFEKTFPGNDRKVYIYFAINKNLLEQYFETGKCPKMDRKAEYDRDAIVFGKKELNFFSNHVMKLYKYPLYFQFRRWCRAKKITEEDGLAIALDLLMRTYDAENYEETMGEYEPITVLDKPLFQEIEKGEDQEVSVTYSSFIFAQAEKIIDRWNRDPDNRAKKRMDFETYCNNALALLNKSMPEKYQDEAMYYQDLKSKSANKKN